MCGAHLHVQWRWQTDFPRTPEAVMTEAIFRGVIDPPAYQAIPRRQTNWDRMLRSSP